MTRVFLKLSIKAKMLLLNSVLLLFLSQAFIVISFQTDSWWISELLFIPVLFLGLALTTSFSRNLVKRIDALTNWVQRIADGDLQHKSIEHISKDELGKMETVLEYMLLNLGAMVGQITETALSVNSASNEIVASNKRQEVNSTSQASAVEEIQRTMVSLLASSKQITESTKAVFGNAEKTLDNNQIIAVKIENLNEQTQRIAEILELIKNIADKSDLLALNASLEGTRAGEAGRGFSLVADEMRKLAENVMGSVKDIKQLVDDIRKSSHSSVLAAEEGMTLSKHTTDSARQISLITQQQQTGTEQVTQSMEEIRDLLNQSVVGSKESTEAARELLQLSERLRVLVFNFKLDDEVLFSEDAVE
jgi:methyl-accepting chemotaxis protein